MAAPLSALRKLAVRMPGHVRVSPPERVTSVGAREQAPEAAGLKPEHVDKIWRAVTDWYAGGLQPGIGVRIRRRGQVILDRAIGHERGNGPADGRGVPKVPATPDTLWNLFSASKCVTAMLVHWLDDEGLLHLDDAICEYIPEFARHGKADITIRHVLTHRAGIPVVPGDRMDPELLADPERIIAEICDAEPTWKAGRRLAYHALTGGFVLAEIIARVTGKPIRQVLAETVREPLGMKTFDYGVPEDRADHVAQHAFTGPKARPPYSWFLERALGVSMERAVTLSNDRRFQTAVVPSGNIIGTADEACRFMELLLRDGELDGTRVFSRRTVRRAVAETSYLELDSIMMIPVRYGMGFMLGGNHFSFYGADSAQAFGHLGFTNVLAYADPARDISVAIMNNGKPFITPGQVAWLNVMRVIAQTVPKV